MNQRRILKKKLKKNGYLLIEALVALLISTIVSFLAIAFLQVALRLFLLKDDSQLQFAILQIRQELAICDSISVEDDILTYIFNHEERQIYFDKHRLVKTPGYEILMENVDEGHVYEEDSKIFIDLEGQEFQLY